MDLLYALGKNLSDTAKLARDKIGGGAQLMNGRFGFVYCRNSTMSIKPDFKKATTEVCSGIRDVTQLNCLTKNKIHDTKCRIYRLQKYFC
jgi:hypothetical protein